MMFTAMLTVTTKLYIICGQCEYCGLVKGAYKVRPSTPFVDESATDREDWKRPPEHPAPSKFPNVCTMQNDEYREWHLLKSHNRVATGDL